MAILTPFWKWLEMRPDRTAVMAEWRNVAQGADGTINGLLQPLNRLALSYPNPRSHGLPMKIVRHADGDIVAVDGNDYEHRIQLQAADCVLYQLDLRKLRSRLCGTLDSVNIAKTPVKQNMRRIQVGNWEPKKAASFPVYWLFSRDRHELQQHILQLPMKRQSEGAILLTPTRTHWDDDLQNLAKKGKMLLVAVDEIIDCVDGAFSATEFWDEYLQAFCQMVKISLPGNFHNKKPARKRAELMAKIEIIKTTLVDHIRSSKDHVYASIDAGHGPRLMKYLTKTELAKLAGLEPYNITRCFKADPQLKKLYEIANDSEQIIKYG